MNDFNDRLLELNEGVVSLVNEISKFKPHFYHAFGTGKLATFAEQLNSHREQLNVIDRELRPHTKIPQDRTSIDMAAGRLSITFSIRNVALTSIGEAQKLLNSAETQAGFKLSTSLALIAIVVSILSVAA